MKTIVIIGGMLGIAIGMVLIAGGNLAIGIAVLGAGILELVVGLKVQKDSNSN